MTPRPLTRSLALIFVTVVAGLIFRFIPLGLPSFVVKYAGSMLWALMIYWIVSTLFPWWHLLIVALISAFLTTAIELFKLYHSPGLDAFRLTLPGILLLGRFFSVRDIVAYWIAIFVGAFLDKRIRLTEH